MAYDLNYFSRKNEQLKPKQSIVKLLRKDANGIRRAAYGVYGMACCLCACFSKCAVSTLHVIDLGNYWINALRVYDTYDAVLINTLFDKAVSILRKKEQDVQRLMGTLTAQSRMQLMQANANPVEHIQTLRTLTTLSTGTWFRETLIECMPHSAKGETIIPITPDEINVLQATYPLFYPSVQESRRWYLPFSIHDRAVTVNALQKFITDVR